MQKKIAVIIGSLRKDSLNRKVANKIIELAKNKLTMQIIEIGDMPHYNEDLETETPPEAWTKFRSVMKDMDGVLFFTPEYNRSIPGALKNAIDVGSRPYGKSIWSGKAGAVVSVAPRALAAFGANHILRQSMVFLNVPMLQQPEMYIGNANDIFLENGELVDDTQAFFQQFVEAYTKWVGTIKD